jgi:hypothetical protein
MWRSVRIAVVLVSFCAAAYSTDYSKRLLGAWVVHKPRRADRIEIFHPDGTWGVRNFDFSQPEDIKGRRWRLDGDRLILTYPTDHGFDTATYKIISFAADRFVTDVGGQRFEHTRFHLPPDA